MRFHDARTKKPFWTDNSSNICIVDGPWVNLELNKLLYIVLLHYFTTYFTVCSTARFAVHFTFYFVSS